MDRKLSKKENNAALTIVIVFGATIIVSIYYIGQVVAKSENETYSPSPYSPYGMQRPSPLVSPTAELSFSPRESTYSRGQEWQSFLSLKTTGKVAGVDAVFTFDPVLLQIVEIDKQAEIYTMTKAQIDNKKGTARVSFLARPGTFFTGEITLGAVRVKGVRTGEGVLGLDFSPTMSKSNAAEFATGKDLLTAVINGYYRIE